MAEAAITLKLSPREFDMVRESIEESADTLNGIVRDTANAPADVRRAAREREAQLRDVLAKLHA